MDQIFSEYLTAKENKNIEYSLTGFDKLSKKDKETIGNLISYFNASKLQD